jgi:subfamily B ATP-binding cassette protein MsbA
MAMVSAITSLLVSMIKPVMDGIFSASNTVSVPFIGISVERVSLLYYLVIVIILLSAAKGVFEYIQKYYMAYIGQCITKEFRNLLFEHLLSFAMSYYAKNPTGQLLSRITNDVKFLETSIVKIPTRLIKDGFQVIFSLGLLFYFNWRWTLYSLAGFAVIILPFAWFSRILRRISRKGHQSMADIYDFLSEKISGIRLIKAFSTEAQEIERMKEVNNGFVDLMLKSEKINAMQSALTEVLSAVGMVAIILIGGLAVIENSISPGTFFVFIGLLSTLYVPAKNFANVNQQLQRAFAASERIFQILDHDEYISEVSSPVLFSRLKDSIEFRDLSFSYNPGEPVLEGISLKIPRGYMTAFVGPSGAGKTTLVNLVPRFFEPGSGELLIDGTNISEYDTTVLRRRIGLIMQDVVLFNMTIRENISYGTGDIGFEKIVEYSKAANAHDFINSLPQGYDTVVGERGLRLSGGQKQRISIARALIKDPEIIIMDEATAHLDTESEQLVQEAMERLVEGRTTLIIAHRLSTVTKADLIVVLEDGKIIEMGSHDELLLVPGLYKKMFEIQNI